MRITRQARTILALMLCDPGAEYYGLELARAGGLFTGTVYPVLGRMERNGWLEGGWERIDPRLEKRPRRRYYKLTALGLEQAQALGLSPAEEALVKPDRRPVGLPNLSRRAPAM
jgi:PadR family transcriptional regulator PadR